MRNTIFFVALVLMSGLLSCRGSVDERTKLAIEWANSHPKPITITGKITRMYLYDCMFVDSAGTVFYAGEVDGFRPGTIETCPSSYVGTVPCPRE